MSFWIAKTTDESKTRQISEYRIRNQAGRPIDFYQQIQVSHLIFPKENHWMNLNHQIKKINN